MKLPHFLIIANKRCGTSWINANLKEHPQIFIPTVKGTHFFDQNFDKGLTFYAKYFEEAKEKQAVGETEHSYFWDDSVPQRIHNTLGTISLVLSLRQPVERAYSFYQLKYRDQRNFNNDFESFFMRSVKENHHVYTWGNYANQLKKYLKYFPMESFYFIKFEDITLNPLPTIQELYKFLGVDDSYVPSLINHKWTQATNLPEGINPLIKKVFYTSIMAIYTRKAIRKLFNKKIQIFRPFSPPPLNPEIKRRLTGYYDEDIEQLTTLTKIDFSSWLSKNQ